VVEKSGELSCAAWAVTVVGSGVTVQHALVGRPLEANALSVRITKNSSANPVPYRTA
jgi:transketolase C-terminal domain/subunit